MAPSPFALSVIQKGDYDGMVGTSHDRPDAVPLSELVDQNTALPVEQSALVIDYHGNVFREAYHTFIFNFVPTFAKRVQMSRIAVKMTVKPENSCKPR